MGGHRDKHEMVNLIRSVITLTGTPLERPGPDGHALQRFQGHVLRVAGAQMLARWGLDLYLIQLIARWGSRAVERYVQEAPLHLQDQVACCVTDRIFA